MNYTIKQRERYGVTLAMVVGQFEFLRCPVRKSRQRCNNKGNKSYKLLNPKGKAVIQEFLDQKEKNNNNKQNHGSCTNYKTKNKPSFR